MKILKENLIIHDSLNTKLFNEEGLLKEDVRESLIKIVNQFINDLKENKIPIYLVDIWLVGSNTSYNYTNSSNIDLHLIVNFDEVSEEKGLLGILYSYVKSDFNKSYDIKIKGLEVEIYIEDIATTAVTNGVYSVLHGEWIKYPNKITVPSINVEETDLYNIFYEQYKNLTSIEDIQDFIDRLYILRKSSLINDGEFGLGNLIFKEFRNKRILDELKDKIKELKSKELTLEKLN